MIICCVDPNTLVEHVEVHMYKNFLAQHLCIKRLLAPCLHATITEPQSSHLANNNDSSECRIVSSYVNCRPKEYSFLKFHLNFRKHANGSVLSTL